MLVLWPIIKSIIKRLHLVWFMCKKSLINRDIIYLWKIILQIKNLGLVNKVCVIIQLIMHGIVFHDSLNTWIREKVLECHELLKQRRKLETLSCYVTDTRISYCSEQLGMLKLFSSRMKDLEWNTNGHAIRSKY